MFLITEFKRCRCCQETLPAADFYFKKQNLGLDSYCKRCRCENNKPYFAANQEKRRAYQKTYRERETNKERRNAVATMRRHGQPLFRLQSSLRSRIWNALNGIAAKSKRTLELIGCSVSGLRAHLEKQFKPGMTWENYGPAWHVDHIRPCASFDLTAPAQQRECFHFSNLQPLWAKDNLSKGDKYGNSSR